MATVTATPTAEEELAATKVQAIARGRSTRREWLDQQLAKQGLGPLDVPSANADTYPLYCMPVPTFLKLDGWIPHQEALAQGLLVEYDPATMADDLLFISHQVG